MAYSGHLLQFAGVEEVNLRVSGKEKTMARRLLECDLRSLRWLVDQSDTPRPVGPLAQPLAVSGFHHWSQTSTVQYSPESPYASDLATRFLLALASHR